MYFHCQYSCLENFKCSLWATLKCLAGRIWPADRTLPRPALEGLIGKVRKEFPTNGITANVKGALQFFV